MDRRVRSYFAIIEVGLCAVGCLRWRFSVVVTRWARCATLSPVRSVMVTAYVR